ncbi:T-cell activation inhibitor, mitochondrial [Toxocara canis]|uniref:T-cell activation inhibitor, mitochondrial n=1 Tax=Toxocara canis TaxID=6265 RepID=A0A0B2UY83_TOXCA|nr:T-cell activation inhibitor, mitochondrial [Toxocara canis]
MCNSRFMSSQQAAVALRPFYFAVHPDRFANNPDIRAHNERSLQTFNGYLNDLFPLRRPPSPVKVDFYLAEKGVRQLRKVQITLSGSDARSIIVAALEKCNLPTTNLPTSSAGATRTGQRRSAFDSSEISAAEEMIQLFRKKHSKFFIRSDDLTAALQKHRDTAIQATKAFEKTSRLLQEEVDELRERADIVVVQLGQIAYEALLGGCEQTHRSCFAIDKSKSDYRSPTFGRCSFICCDGGMQFGVQDVPEEWQRVCNEASVRRTQLSELTIARNRLSQLMGNAHIVTPPERSLAQAVSQIQSGIRKMQFANDELTNIISRKTSRLLQEEVDELRERAGITEILWLSSWAKSHMRRCLVAVNRLIDHVSPSTSRNPIIEALRGYCLRFGRCSFICCDGGMQFGVQDVPEEWQRVCNEASVRRTQLSELTIARNRLSQLMGNAHIVTPPERSLAQAVSQIQSLIVRILARDDSERACLQTLGADTLIEVVSAYDELALGKDGRLFMPCNAGIDHVIEFLKEKAHLSRQINASLHQLQCDVENVRRDCIMELKLRDLTWQQGINLEELLSSLNRLQRGESSLHELLVDMWLHFDTNPTIHVMSDGRLSVPLQWV